MNYIQQIYKGNNQWYFYVITIIVVLFTWQVLGGIPILVVAGMYAEDTGALLAAAQNNFTGLGIDSNLYLLLIISMFAIGLAGLFFCVKYLHKRSITSLITSREKIDWKRFWFAFLTWGLVSVVVISIGIVLSPEDYTWNFKPVPFFTLVVVSFLFLPIQTSFEELLFRGYLLQAFGGLFKNRWLPLVLTGTIFGLLHGANPEVAKLGYITMVFYIGTGLFYGILTLIDEGTELALGFHAINNIMAAVFVTANWTVFQTDALFVDTSEPSVGAEMFIPVFVLYPLMFFILSKKYGWKNWKEKLFGNISRPVDKTNINEIGEVSE